MVRPAERLVRARQSYTNESYCQARAEIRSFDTRTTLIPMACPSQAEFETEILNHVGYGICPQDLDSGVRQPFGIRSMIPRRQGLDITLGDCDGSLVEFISRISPLLHEDGYGVSGIVGLRVTFTKRGAVLRRRHAAGIVVLQGVSKEVWYSALVESFEDINVIETYLGNLDGLHEAERSHIEEYLDKCDTSPRSTHVGKLIISGILRRAHMLRARSIMRFIDLWFNFMRDHVVINIEWAGDLSHFDLIHRLVDRRFGLPLELSDHDVCYCEPCTANTYSIDMRDSLGGNLTLHLRRSSLYESDLPARKTGPCQLNPTGSPSASDKYRGAIRAQ